MKKHQKVFHFEAKYLSKIARKIHQKSTRTTKNPTKSTLEAPKALPRAIWAVPRVPFSLVFAMFSEGSQKSTENLQI